MLEKIHQWFIGRRFKMMHFFVGSTVLYTIIVVTVSVVPILYMKRMLDEVIPVHTKNTLDQIVEKSGDQLETLAATMMKEKARDVARQVALLTKDRPIKELMGDDGFHRQAVQTFLKTGYTAVFECGSMVTVAHVQRNLEGISAYNFANEFPSWWSIFKKGVDCQEFHGKYQWAKTDGVLRDKYMVISPVPGSRLMVAATIYLDEFDESKNEIRDIGRAEGETLLSLISRESTGLVMKASSTAVILFLLLISASLVFSTTILSYLKRISIFAKSLASQNYTHQMDAPPKIEELHQIQNDLNTMRETIIAYHNESCQQASSVAHSNLARQVAHDLRAPVETLEIVSSELKEKTETNSVDLDETIERIEHIYADLSGMIESILAPKNNYLGRVQRFDLGKLLDTLARYARKRALQQGKLIQVDLSKGANDLFIIGSVQNIRRVFFNLVENAIDAIDDRGSILIEATVQSSKIRVRVKDSGKGIPAGREEDIFKEGVSIGKVSGTGIGLHVSRMIVSEHGGDIKAKRRRNGGSTFEVSFPAMLEVLGDQAPGPYSVAIPAGKEIVAVDDKVEVLSKIYTLSAPKGIAGHFFTSFEEFLDAVDINYLKEKCGQIVLDNLIPGSKYDAISMGRYLRKELGDAVPIVICTSDHKDEKLQKFGRETGIPVYSKSVLMDASFTVA